MLLQVRFNLALKSCGSSQAKPDILVQRTGPRQSYCVKNAFPHESTQSQASDFFPPAIKGMWGDPYTHIQTICKWQTKKGLKAFLNIYVGRFGKECIYLIWGWKYMQVCRSYLFPLFLSNSKQFLSKSAGMAVIWENPLWTPNTNLCMDVWFNNVCTHTRTHTKSSQSQGPLLQW